MSNTFEKSKQLYDLTIMAGRRRQSPQTGYVHLCYQIEDESFHHTIPVVENVTFSLGLLRSRTSENITEARGYLEKLLKFQNVSNSPDRGNFPVYLHEHPACKDRWLGTRLLAPFFWIQKLFTPVLGAHLTADLVHASKELLQYCLRALQDYEAPFQIGLMIAGAAKAFGEDWNDDALIAEGNRLLEHYRNESLDPNFGSWFSPANIAETLTALSMAYPDIKNSPWEHFWKHIERTWDPEALTYVGPGIKEGQAEFEPQVTLYDIYMGCINGTYAYRSLCEGPVQLHAAVVQVMHEQLEQKTPFEITGELAGRRWSLHRTPSYALSLIQKQGNGQPNFEKYFTPLKLIWGDRNMTHSLISQGGCAEYVDYELVEGGVDMIYFLQGAYNDEDREKNREIVLYMNRHEDCVINVENKPSNTFQLGEWISCKDNHLEFKIKFTLEDGSARFFGHIMPGNRLSQVALKGEQRYNAYDKLIFLRTVRRGVPCRVRCSIRIV